MSKEKDELSLEELDEIMATGDRETAKAVEEVKEKVGNDIKKILDYLRRNRGITH